LPDSLALYFEIQADLRLAGDKIAGLRKTQNRHGDLQVAFSASKRVSQKIAALIEMEHPK
jgi:hypothetical protein